MSALAMTGVTAVRGSGAHRVEAVTDATVAIERREVVILEGPSGSGKTTLLSVAAGLLRAGSGSVVLDGNHLDRMSVGRIRSVRAQAVGFVFQRANLLPNLTAIENVLLAARLAGFDRRTAAAAARELLGDLGVDSLADRRPEALSGGEEQRIAVARALVHAPALVLADEPTASLDSEAGRAVAERLVKLAVERETAVLIATHDARLKPYADRSIRIADGVLAPNE